MYRASLGVAQQQGKRLRVVLRLTAPELAALPWEMLFDPETETYLCRHEPLVRHVHAPYTAEPTSNSASTCTPRPGHLSPPLAPRRILPWR